MKVTVRREGDRERLDELIAREKVAVQRDRLRAVRLALGGVEALGIAATLGRSRRFVQEWAYAYRDGGVEAITPGKSSGRPT
jgi:transposase